MVLYCKRGKGVLRLHEAGACNGSMLELFFSALISKEKKRSRHVKLIQLIYNCELWDINVCKYTFVWFLCSSFKFELLLFICSYTLLQVHATNFSLT